MKKWMNKTVEVTVDTAVERSTVKLADKVKLHFEAYRKVYFGIAGGLVAGATLARHQQTHITVSPTIVIDITPQVEKVPETIIVPATGQPTEGS